jgi:hypothetical protein
MRQPCNAGHVAPIEANSALRCVTITGYEKESAEQVHDIVQQAAGTLKEAHPFLSFSRLERLTVGSDYRAALELHETEGRAFSAEFMNNAETTLGVTLPTQTGVVVIIHPQVMAQMRSTEHAETSQGCRIFMHELCHAHDIGLRGEWLLRRARTQRDADPLYWQCNALWAEYFANRYSHFQGCDQRDDWRRLELLLEHLHAMKPEHAALQLAASFGYALGTLAALNADVHEAQPDMARRVRAEGFAPAWLEARTVTDELAQTGQCWHREDGVLRLATAVRLIENTCRYRTR